MSESRGELIAWVNDLLHLNYTKVEQLGTGTYCTELSHALTTKAKEQTRNHHRSENFGKFYGKLGRSPCILRCSASRTLHLSGTRTGTGSK
jgi:hypothetical protein